MPREACSSWFSAVAARRVAAVACGGQHVIALLAGETCRCQHESKPIISLYWQTYDSVPYYVGQVPICWIDMPFKRSTLVYFKDACCVQARFISTTS